MLPRCHLSEIFVKVVLLGDFNLPSLSWSFDELFMSASNRHSFPRLFSCCKPHSVNEVAYYHIIWQYFELILDIWNRPCLESRGACFLSYSPVLVEYLVSAVIGAECLSSDMMRVAQRESLLPNGSFIWGRLGNKGYASLSSEDMWSVPGSFK